MICKNICWMWGISSDGSVCHGSDLMSAPVCFTSTESGRVETRSVLLPVGRPRSLRLSPFPLIHRVLLRVRESQSMRVTLVAPLWPQVDWFSLLLDLLVDSPRELPSWRPLLRQPHRHLFHRSHRRSGFACGDFPASSQSEKFFHTRLLDSCLSQSDSPFPQLTRQSQVEGLL